jgi:hypothetical protein
MLRKAVPNYLFTYGLCFVFRKLTVANAAVEASSKAAKLAALQASIAAKLSMVKIYILF